MYNFLPVFLGFLHKLDLISEEAYHKFSEKLKDKIFSADSKLTKKMLDDVFEEVEKELKSAKIEPWLVHIQGLERRTSEVEKELEAMTKIVANNVVKPLKNKNVDKKSS